MRAVEVGTPHLVHDVGGLCEDNWIETGRLLRGGFIVPFAAENAARLRANGMTAILDLRSDREAGKLPQDLRTEPGVDYRRIPIGDEASRPLPGQCASLGDLYVRHLTMNGPALAEAVAFAVAPREGAVLVHCRTGRDRTGLVVALALSLAGWQPRIVMAHHAQAAEVVAPIVARRRAAWLTKGKDLEFFDTMNSGAVPAMAQALEWITHQHGTVAQFLTRHGAPETLQRHAAERLGSCSVDEGTSS